MKERLHPFHLSLLIFMIQSGVIIFSLPRIIAQYMGYNGWATLILFSGIAMINILLIGLVYQLSRGKSIFIILEHSLPKILIFPLYTVLISVWTILGCMVAKQYVIIFQVYVFPTTHPMYIKALVDIVTFILVIKGIYNISKAATSFFGMVIWMNLLLLFFLKDFQWMNLTPFYFQKSTDIWIGGLSIYSAFLGYELTLLLFPYSEKNKGLIKAVFVGNLMTTLTYIAVCFVCFGFYSFNQLKKMKYPLIDLLAYIKFPFVERIENLFFGFFLFTTLVTIAMYIWAAKEALHRVIPRANTKWLTAFLLGSAFVVSWIPDTLSKTEKWLKYLGFIEIGVAFGLPLLLIVVLLVNKGVKNNA